MTVKYKGLYLIVNKTEQPSMLTYQSLLEI